MCRPAPFARNGGSTQATKAGAGNHQLLCRQAREGQPRALPDQSRRRGGRASSTDGRGRASRRHERCLSLFGLEMDPWIWNTHAAKRFVRPSPPVSDRPNISALPATLHSRLTSRLPVLAPAGAQARAAWRRLQSAETHFWRGCAPCKALSEIEVASLADLLTCFKNIHLFSRTFLSARMVSFLPRGSAARYLP